MGRSLKLVKVSWDWDVRPVRPRGGSSSLEEGVNTAEEVPLLARGFVGPVGSDFMLPWLSTRYPGM